MQAVTPQTTSTDQSLISARRVRAFSFLEFYLMNKPKSDEQPPVAQQLPAPKAVGLPRTFRDTVFTSRTLITPQGQSLPVVRGLVTAATAEQNEFLQSHPDLEYVPE